MVDTILKCTLRAAPREAKAFRIITGHGSDFLKPREDALDRLHREADEAEAAARRSAEPALVMKETEAEKAKNEAGDAAYPYIEAKDKAKKMHDLAKSEVSKAALDKAEKDLEEPIREYIRKLREYLSAYRARLASEDPEKRKAANEAFKRYMDAMDEWLRFLRDFIEKNKRWLTEPKAEKVTPPVK